METNALTQTYHDMLTALTAQRKYVRIFYFTDLHELLSVTSIINRIATEADGEYLELASGDTIRLDRVVNVDGVYAPGQEDYEECLHCRVG